MFDGPVTHVDPADFSFAAGRQNFVPIFEQSAYKYLIYVEGHCAACRYGFMMRLGSVILKVESRCVADRTWYMPLLRPWVDHVPVRADLSDLLDKVRWCRAHDRLAKRSRESAPALVMHLIATASWTTCPDAECPPRAPCDRRRLGDADGGPAPPAPARLAPLASTAPCARCA